MKYPCENCKLRAAYDKNPKSLIGRFWRWQINFCPSWRGYFKSLPPENYAGFSHLTFNRQEFVAQVPTWLQFSEGFTDFVVLASGVVEIALGLGMLLLWKKKAVVGALLALFYVAIFPGNINQYVNHIDAFGLNTDNLRLIRLFIQPVLIYLALWSTGGWQQLKSWWQCLTKSKKA